jgi:hypothetical protein
MTLRPVKEFKGIHHRDAEDAEKTGRERNGRMDEWKRAIRSSSLPILLSFIPLRVLCVSAVISLYNLSYRFPVQ